MKEMDAPSTRMAVRACWRCPARAACADYAVAADEPAGVWGGLLPDERVALWTASAA
jgi:WhiB family redox-sensing transcriptional regulator